MLTCFTVLDIQSPRPSEGVLVSASERARPPPEEADDTPFAPFCALRPHVGLPAERLISSSLQSRRAPGPPAGQHKKAITMALPNPTNLTEAPSWSLQRKRSIEMPTGTPASASAKLFEGSFFQGWTDVPFMPRQDPYISDQLRPGKRVDLVRPVSDHAQEPFAGGKRIVGPHHSVGGFEGKRAFPHISGARCMTEVSYGGLKRVESRARSDVPSLADPNTAVKDATYKPESVKMFDGTNQVKYRCWQPQDLGKAEYGDWNWNSRPPVSMAPGEGASGLGFRKVRLTESGEPRRSLEQPVAWPGYKGYPPTLQAGTNTRIDYALKVNGRHEGFTLKTQHPDVLESRANRAAASAPGGKSGSGLVFTRGAY